MTREQIKKMKLSLSGIKTSLKRRLKSPLIALLLSLSPALALADSDQDMLSTILTDLVALLTSDIAKTIFILSIIGLGYGWLYLGRIPKGRAIGAILGIGIVFSAGWITQQLGIP